MLRDTNSEMPRQVNLQLNQGCETQLAAIRDLMLSAGNRGTWLTLSEIAADTEFGEASISAQLRHLRKARYGHYLVEKRRRTRSSDCAGNQGGEGATGVWEYRVYCEQ